jgi:hypothetical protein
MAHKSDYGTVISEWDGNGILRRMEKFLFIEK